ncbi:MAG: right-handed parallel beta-helix repeat-containing protein [Syntrophobacteraceae bacterium]|nr:right-handed parallel beta-helix repeat-containing protein [Syntrophobacteraceae bacterium]
MRHYLLTFLLSAYLFLPSSPAGAASCGAGPFYVSSCIGSDSNNGASPSTPWAHHPWDANVTGNAACTLAAGNTVYMRRGDVWYNCGLNVAQTGSSGSPITTTSTSSFYAVSPSDPLPILSGAYTPSSLTWSQDGSYADYYVSGTTPIPVNPYVVAYNGAVLPLAASQAACQTTNPSWWYNSTTQTVYANVGQNPATGTLEIAKQGHSIRVPGSTYNYLTFSYLQVQSATTLSSDGIVSNNKGGNVIFDHLAIKEYPFHAVYVFMAAGTQVTNSAISGGEPGQAGDAIYANTCTAPLAISGNTMAGNVYGMNSGVDVSATPGAVVSNNTITGYGNGVFIQGAGNGFAVYLNTVYGNSNNGVEVSTAGSGAIYSNLLYNNFKSGGSYNFGIYLFNSSNNQIYKNQTYGNESGYYPGSFGGGIDVAGSGSGNLIYQNYSHNDYLGISLVSTSGTGGNQVYDNVVVGSRVNDINVGSTATGYDYVYNNTVVHNPSPLNTPPYIGHGIVSEENNAYAKIFNNIIYIMQTGTGCNGLGVIAAAPVSIEVDNNIYYDATAGQNAHIAQLGPGNIVEYTSLAAWKSAAAASGYVFGMDGVAADVDAHSLSSNPLFKNGSGNFSLPTDFALGAFSPAINAGAFSPIAQDYAGNPIEGPPDIGAYEYQLIAGPARVWWKGALGTGTF